MSEDKQFKIDIPESIEGYKVTLFWGLGIKQIVLVFGAILFLGLAVLNFADHHFMVMAEALIIIVLLLLGMIEIRGRNFYKHCLFIFSYYKSKPRVLTYKHYSSSGATSIHTKQLVFQREDNTKTFIIIFIGLAFGLLLLILAGVYIYNVIHQ